MIDREKMIEEIEKVLQLEQIKIANTTEEFAKLQKDGINRCNAEALYNAGCLKVSEDMVVLTREEYERLQNVENDLQRYTIELYNRAREAEDEIEQVRKETARDFATELITIFRKQQDRYDQCIERRKRDYDRIDENDVQLREYTIMCEGKENGQAVMADKAELYIRTILKDKYGVEVE